MNKYSLNLNESLGEPELKALMLLLLASNDFTISANNADGWQVASGTLPFSLSNLSTSPASLTQTLFDSETQNTLEGFDKPIIEQGDIVLAVVESANSSRLGKYYQEFQRIGQAIPVVCVSPVDGVTPLSCVVYVGVSNSSKSDFNEPFKEAIYTVISSQQNLGELFVNLDIL